MDERHKQLAEEFLFSEKPHQNFAKSLFFGLFDFEKVLFSKKENPEEERLIRRVREFAQQQIDPQWIDQHAEIPSKIIKGLGEIGLLGLTIPKEYGGLGLSQRTYCRAMEELARVCGSTALFVNAHQSVGLKALLLFGTAEQKKRYLPPLASGEQLAAFSLTEPDAGSDASAIKTRAHYDPNKKNYCITGKKQWTTNGSIASVLTVMAKTEEAITAFLVHPQMPGFKVCEEGLDKVGMRGTKTSNLQFEQMEVPEENILGMKGKGLKICLTVLDYGRTTFGATCTGAAKYAFERAVAYARSRHQFNRPLASFALIKEKITQMAALTYAMEATTYLTAHLVDQGVKDFMLEAAMLKVFASESLWTIIYETMQIFGGKAFFTDEPWERMMRDARLNMIGEGANEVLRVFIAGVGSREVGEMLTQKRHWWFFLRQYLFARAKGKSTFPSELKLLHRSVRKFHIGVIKALVKYREEIVEKQLILSRITTAAIALYTATAVLVKMENDLKENKDISVGRYYITRAKKRVDCCIDHLFSSEDHELETLAKHLTGVS